jgi:hypothetical protein
MKDKATFEISGNFECKKDAPFDTRWRVDAYEDLINEETWRNKDGNIYAYTGMCTTCKDKPGKIYQLTDVTHLTDYAYWKEIGEQKLIEIVNNLTSEDTNKALSAAMGKKLNDEKLDKSAITTDIINSEDKVASASSVFNVNTSKLDKSAIVDNVNSTDVTKVLSAAQGKVLNDRINSLGSVYKYKGNKNTIEEVLALTDAKIGDVWDVIQEFSAGGKKYPAGTNIACIKNTSTSEHSEANWDTLGGTVDLSGYATKTEMNNNLNNKVDKSAIVNDLTTGGTTNVLSAEQGKQLDTDIHALEDNIQGLNQKIPTNTSQLTNDSNYVTSNNVLTKDNATEYNPVEEYHPATKKYVDDKHTIFTITKEAHQQLISNQFVKGEEAETKINLIFQNVEVFKAIVTHLLKDNILFLKTTEKEIFKVSTSHTYCNPDNGAYELSFIYTYTAIVDANNISLVTKRIFIALNSNATNFFVVKDILVSDNLTTLTKKTAAEYEAIGSKDANTAYCVTD